MDEIVLIQRSLEQFTTEKHAIEEILKNTKWMMCSESVDFFSQIYLHSHSSPKLHTVHSDYTNTINAEKKWHLKRKQNRNKQYSGDLCSIFPDVSIPTGGPASVRWLEKSSLAECAHPQQKSRIKPSSELLQSVMSSINGREMACLIWTSLINSPKTERGTVLQCHLNATCLF